MIAGDWNGELIQTKTRVYEGLNSAEWTEAMAIKEALSWSDRGHWERVEIKSDCLVAVQAIRSRVAMRSPFAQLPESYFTLKSRFLYLSQIHKQRCIRSVSSDIKASTFVKGWSEAFI